MMRLSNHTSHKQTNKMFLQRQIVYAIQESPFMLRMDREVGAALKFSTNPATPPSVLL